MKKIFTAVLVSMIGCSVANAFELNRISGKDISKFSDLAVKAADLNALAVARGIAVPTIPKGHIEPFTPIKWVSISGGNFTMGTTDIAQGADDAKPIHEVAIKTFQMTKTDVTVEQYAKCVAKGDCTAPISGKYCNWGKADRQLHPVNCVTWDQANQYARFMGARLPSESEWEYAATSGGKNYKYPWGNDEPTCDKAVMAGNGDYGCSTNATMPVCSKPAGNTAQGLCDMSGNVWQWVQDKYLDSYTGAPSDGSAFEAAGYLRVLRGGAFYLDAASHLRSDYRGNGGPGRLDGIGFRLARSR